MPSRGSRRDGPRHTIPGVSPPPPGGLAGTVLNAADASPVAGVTVSLRRGPKTTTDASGRFELPELAAGDGILELSGPGFTERTLTVTIAAGETAEHTVLLEPLESFAAAITVTAPDDPDDVAPLAPAIVQGLAAEELAALPATSAADAAERLPGVVIERDRGEADRVFIRGAEPRLVSTMLDGERLPSPGGRERTAGLGLVPTELLAGVEVRKSFSPELDADAIGGTVNLVTHRPPADGLATFGLSAGWDALGGGPLNSGMIGLGRRTLDERLGVLLTLTSGQAARGADQIETRYDDGAITRLELRDYSLVRDRRGALLSLDYAPTDRTELSLRGFFSGFSEAEKRRRVKNDVDDEIILRELKDSFLERDVRSLTADGQHLLGPRFKLDYRLSYQAARERQPHRIDTSFIQEDVSFVADGSGGIVPEGEDLSCFRLFEIGIEDNATSESNGVAAVNLATPLVLGSRFRPELRAGLKIRRKDKRQDTNTTLFASPRGIPLSEFLDPAFPGGARVGRYLLGPMVDPQAARELIARFGLTGYRSLEEDAGDYTAAETTAAGYVLAERPGAATRLPGQAELSGNLTVGYDLGKLSASLGGTYVGEYLVELGGAAAEDVWVDEQWRLDLSVGLKVGPRWRLTLHANNLTDAPRRLYEGTPEYPIQVERVGWAASLGLRLRL